MGSEQEMRGLVIEPGMGDGGQMGSGGEEWERRVMVTGLGMGEMEG